jgi:hypothetical protein
LGETVKKKNRSIAAGAAGCNQISEKTRRSRQNETVVRRRAAWCARGQKLDVL